MRTLSTSDINALLQWYVTKTFEYDEIDRVEESCFSKDTHQELMRGYAELEEHARAGLAHSDYSLVKKEAERLLQDNGYKVEPDSFPHQKLCREMLKMQVQMLEVFRRRENGFYDDEGTPIQTAPLSQHLPSLLQPEPSEPLSKVIAQYTEEQEKGNRWSEKSQYEITKSLNLLIKVLGNVSVKAIDHNIMRDYKKTLTQLPANMSKFQQYQGMTIEQILATKPGKCLSTTTVNKLLDRASSLFNWAVKNGYMDRNPAQGMQITQKNREDEERKIFTRDELHSLFHSKDYLEDNLHSPYAFWLPVLGLFTGARIEELCQLHLEDIRMEGGVWVFDINDKQEKKLKNKSSRRLVPLHPSLIESLHLIDYVQKLKAAGEIRLFPELDRKRDGYSPVASKWFGRYRKQCGIVDSGKVFHSFRHTFVDNLKQNQIDGYIIAEIVGHAVDSMTMGRYGKRYTPKVLLEQAIEKLSYNVDLSHLSMSRFVRVSQR